MKLSCSRGQVIAPSPVSLLTLFQVKEGVVIPRHFYTWPDAVTRSIESTLFTSGSSQDSLFTPSGLGLRRMQSKVRFIRLYNATY